MTMLSWNNPPARDADSPLRFRKMHGSESDDAHGDAVEESACRKRGEIPRDAAARRRNRIKCADWPQHVTATMAITRAPGDKCTGNVPLARDCNAEGGGGEGKYFAKRTRDTGDDSCAEQNKIPARLTIRTT